MNIYEFIRNLIGRAVHAGWTNHVPEKWWGFRLPDRAEIGYYFAVGWSNSLEHCAIQN